MFAVLREELARVLHWFEDLREAVTGHGASPTQWERADGSVVRLMEHFRTVVAERQAQPGDDLLSAMITVEVGGERFTTDELVALCVQLLDGHQPTVFPLISNGMLALLRNPDQLQRLRDEPALLQQMVEELLRYAGAQQSGARVATEDVEIGGRLIRQDEKVALMVVAANRDPAQFLDADRLDVGRQPNRHLAFGLGSHFCLGAPLLRVEAPIIFRGLLKHLPGLRLDQSRPVRWAGNFSARRVVELPVLMDSTASL
jgi:hypothetical protein